MQYLIAAYWMWFVVALLAGGAVGYWSPGRQVPEGGISHLLSWGAVAFLAGLAVAVLHWFPLGVELHLETLLLLSFWFALGGLLGRWLRAAKSRKELASAALVSNAQAESAMLSARAKAAVRFAQDSAASTKAIEDARLAAEAKAAELGRVAAAAKAAEDERLAVEAKAADQARAAAAAKAAEDARLAVEAKAAELARVAAAAKAAEEDRLVAEAKAARQARLAVAAKALENARLAVEARAAELAHVAGAATAAEDDRVGTEAKAAEQARPAAAAKPAEDKATQEPPVAATVAQPEAFHPGRMPQGIAAPVEGEADDLKLIKGIGPRNERACNALGVYQFRQIADWTPEEAIWVGHHIGFPERIEREHWIAQARLLGSGGETEHSRAVKSGAIVVDDKADEPLDPVAAEILGRSLPEQAAVVDGEATHPGRRPYGLATALGKADNLKRIRGIGPQNAGRLHGLGIWHFWQVAAWTDENVKWVGSYLAFSGRIHRENWVAQARDLAAGNETESPRRAAGKVAASKDDGSLGEGNVQTSK